MAQYTITEEQIKELAKWKHGKRLTQEWFPEVFKPKLEEGKWYNYGRSLLNYQGLKNYLIQAYGFLHDKSWLEISNCGDDFKEWKLSTHEEVESALIAEAKKRGFADGVEYKNTDGETHICGGLYFGYNGIHSEENQGMIFENGVWAEVIKEKTLSKSEAEAKLTELINDGFEYKIEL